MSQCDKPTLGGNEAEQGESAKQDTFPERQFEGMRGLGACNTRSRIAHPFCASFDDTPHRYGQSVEQDSESRYWVLYDFEGNVAVLYKLSFSGYFFQRWDADQWVDASDRYLRITRDAACDEVSAERAQQIISEFSD